MAIIDVVKFDGLKSRDWIVYKHPSDKLVLGTQLTVKEGQVAIFMKDGRIADIFEPGRYTLSTDNLPLLRGLVNIPFGGTTPFPAEVYFLNTLTKLDIPWGTADPIQLIDPKFGVKPRQGVWPDGIKAWQLQAVFFRADRGDAQKRGGKL